MYEKWKKKTRREVDLIGNAEIDERPRPNFKFNSKVKSELKNAQDIKSSRKKKDGMKLKNMSKDKRKSMLGNAKKQRASKSGNIQIGTKAGQRKVKAVFRR